MTVTEYAIVVIALAAACTGVAAVVVAKRIGAVTRELSPLIAEVRASMKRVEAIANEVEHVVRDARRLEGRVSTIVDGPLKVAGALLQGLQTGLMALLTQRPQRDNPSPPVNGPEAEEMITERRPMHGEGHDHE